MIKKFFKENTLPCLWFIALAIYGIVYEEIYLDISKHLFFSGVITSATTTALFFMIPAKFVVFSFAFMFTAVVLRGAVFALIASFGFLFLPETAIPQYCIFLVITIFFYKVSLVFFQNDETNVLQNEIVKKQS